MLDIFIGKTSIWKKDWHLLGKVYLLWDKIDILFKDISFKIYIEGTY